MLIWTETIQFENKGKQAGVCSLWAGEQESREEVKKKKKEWENGRPAQESLFMAAWTLTAIYSTSHPCFQGMKKSTKERESKEGKK